MSRRRGNPLRKVIRPAYRGLSLLNTLGWLLTLHPETIIRHFIRKGVVKGITGSKPYRKI